MHAPRPFLAAPDAHRRVVDEASIVALIVVYGYVHDARGGARERAERSARETLERWIGLGLPFAPDRDGARRFDPVEVVNFYKHAWRHLGDPFVPEHALVQSRMLVLDFHAGTPSFDAPPPVETLAPERFTLTLHREYDVSRAAPGATCLLRLPLPLADDVLRDVGVDFLGPREASVTMAPGRLDARVPHPGTPTATCGVRVSFTSDPARYAARRAHALAADDAALYTRRNEGLVKVTERIETLAGGIAGDEREPFAVVRRFVDHLADATTLGAVHYDRLDPSAPIDSLLDTGVLDCQMASAFLVALCRARAIPARLVSGYLLIPSTPAGHYWAEAWIDGRGWLPFDSAATDLAGGGRDRPWRDYYLGRLDHRMKTQELPRLFNLAPSVRFPASWHTLQRVDGDGVAQSVVDNATGALVYRDRIVVQRGEASVNATPL